MESFGIVPDLNGLDYEFGHFGENYIGVVVQLVASLGSKIIGSIILKRHLQNDGKITGFYIDPKYRGQRAGHLLLSEAVNRAKLSALGGVYLDKNINKDKIVVRLSLTQSCLIAFANAAAVPPSDMACAGRFAAVRDDRL